MRHRQATREEQVVLNTLPTDDHSVIYENDEYVAAVGTTSFDPAGPVWTRLFIWRHDDGPLHSWADLQHIKNSICGEGSEAVELYPAEARKVDRANVTHLWVLPEHEQLWLGMASDDPDHEPSRWWTFAALPA
jgi:hypothetical protein